MIQKIAKVCCRMHLYNESARGRKGSFLLMRRFLVTRDQFLHGRNILVYKCAHTHVVLPMCVYISSPVRNTESCLHMPRPCPSYLESLIDRIFAPSRARRLAGLKRRTTNNKLRNSCPANAIGQYFTRRVEVKRMPDKSGRYRS